MSPHTAFQQPQQSNPFGLQPPQEQRHQPFSVFLQPQNTALPLQQLQQPGFLQPQPTGSNPFRQSMFMAQPTGVASSPFGMGSQPSPFQQQNPALGQTSQSSFKSSPVAPASASAFSATTIFSSSPFSQNPTAQTAADLPTRPASTPLTILGTSAPSSSKSPPEAQPVKSHQTGSRNPFGIPVAPPPPLPKAPTLMELAMGGGSTNGSLNGQQNDTPQQQQTEQQMGSFGGANGIGAFGGGEGKGDMASVASSFSFNQAKADEINTGPPSSTGTFPFLNAQNTAATGSGFSNSVFPSLNSQPTGATTTSVSPSVSLSPALKPQTTGFSGLKAFKPSSSFGTSLLESLPPVPGSSSTSPDASGGTSPTASYPPSTSGGMPSFGAAASGMNSQPMGMNAQPTNGMSFGGFGRSNLGVGSLRPQIAGAAANPFRASTFTSATGALVNTGTETFPSSTSSPSAFGNGAGFGSSSPSNETPLGTFGAGTLGSGFSSNSVQDPSKQQHQLSQPASLI